MTLNNISYPLGLLPGHVIRLCNLERKVSRQGSVYCQYVVISTLQVLEVQTQPPLTIRYGYYMWCWYITPADDNSWLTMLIPYSCWWKVVVTNVDTLPVLMTMLIHYPFLWYVRITNVHSIPNVDTLPLLMTRCGYRCWYIIPVDDTFGLKMLIHYPYWWWFGVKYADTLPLLLIGWGYMYNWLIITTIEDKLGLQMLIHYPC